MRDGQQSNEMIVDKYRTDVIRLSKYLGWLEKKSGNEVTRIFGEEETGGKSMPFPVYDSTLLNFVNDAGSTAFMDFNYQYIYSRYRMRNYMDERTAIENSNIRTMDVLGGILSKYVLGGMRKGSLWTEAVEYQIFYRIVKKAKDIIEYWDIPIQEEALEEEHSYEEHYESSYEESYESVEADNYRESEFTEESEFNDEPEVVEESEFNDEPEVVEESEFNDEPEVVEESEFNDEPEVVEESEFSDEPDPLGETEDVNELEYEEENIQD